MIGLFLRQLKMVKSQIGSLFSLYLSFYASSFNSKRYSLTRFPFLISGFRLSARFKEKQPASAVSQTAYRTGSCQSSLSVRLKEAKQYDNCLLRLPQCCYLFSFHSNPSFVSLISKPRAVSVLRISSEVAQSLLALAFMRCCNNMSTTFP